MAVVGGEGEGEGEGEGGGRGGGGGGDNSGVTKRNCRALSSSPSVSLPSTITLGFLHLEQSHNAPFIQEQTLPPPPLRSRLPFQNRNLSLPSARPFLRPLVPSPANPPAGKIPSHGLRLRPRQALRDVRRRHDARLQRRHQPLGQGGGHAGGEGRVGFGGGGGGGEEGGGGGEGRVGRRGWRGEEGTNIYDPESDTWREGRRLERQLERYEVVSVGGRVYVTEGWWWPFMFRPRGWVYEVERDTWREMGIGMREGWSGVGVAVAGRVFVIAEFGDSPVKVYEEEWDTWRSVGGGRFPRELLKRPFSATAFDDRIYVASSGLNVAIGTVVLNASATATAADVLLTWQVVEAPRAFRELSPSASQVLYA
ncbi:hypothetical protein Fmac_000845 [Flemingia macrophylla]|uniref:Uncharacterized protein n=1 Tax=Flemingia macrophylla TaxID=520843 RepID=A0ABD1NFF0_9FABA